MNNKSFLVHITARCVNYIIISQSNCPLDHLFINCSNQQSLMLYITVSLIRSASKIVSLFSIAKLKKIMIGFNEEFT